MGLFSKKKKNDTPESIAELFANALETANENAQKKNPTLLREQHVWRDDYGLDQSNPIISESLQGTTAYLSRLCTSDGKKFTWSGHTSIRATVHGLSDVGEDRYTLYLDGKPYTDVYFVPYVGAAEFPPAGLCFTDDKRDWNQERLAEEKAYVLGVTREGAKELMAMDADRKKQQNEREIKKKEDEKRISRLYPNVKISKEMDNHLFSTLYDFEFDPVTIYEFVHAEQLLTRKKQFPTGNETRVPSADYYHQFFSGLYRERFDDLKRQITKKTYQQEVAAANELGVPLDFYRQLEELNYPRAKAGLKELESKISELSRQAVELKKKYPNFVIEKETQNGSFVKLIDRISLQEAFEFIHFSECFEKKKEETTSGVIAEPKKVSETTSVKEVEKGSTNRMLFCRKCGKQIPSDSLFCSYCGTKVVQ